MCDTVSLKTICPLAVWLWAWTGTGEEYEWWRWLRGMSGGKWQHFYLIKTIQIQNKWSASPASSLGTPAADWSVAFFTETNYSSPAHSLDCRCCHHPNRKQITRVSRVVISTHQDIRWRPGIITDMSVTRLRDTAWPRDNYQAVSRLPAPLLVTRLTALRLLTMQLYNISHFHGIPLLSMSI